MESPCARLTSFRVPAWPPRIQVAPDDRLRPWPLSTSSDCCSFACDTVVAITPRNKVTAASHDGRFNTVSIAPFLPAESRLDSQFTIDKHGDSINGDSSRPTGIRLASQISGLYALFASIGMSYDDGGL